MLGKEFEDEDTKFICPNFATKFVPGVVNIPKEFYLKFGEKIPSRLLLHVPGIVVWNGIFRREKLRIEGLEKMFFYYSIKPYHLILFEYTGGPSFNIQIYNPYAVEIDYSISSKPSDVSVVDRSSLDISDIEIDKLCGMFSYNAYNSGQGLYELVLRKRHLLERRHYKILKRSAYRKLGIVESMEWVKLTFRNLTWKVKLKWNNGNVYFGSKWYTFVRAGELKEGDIIVFHFTGKIQKYELCVYENDLLSKCNIKGLGHKTGMMNWYKVVNESVLLAGEMEIPRVFMQSVTVSLSEKMEFLMGDGESFAVHFNARRNSLHGMRKVFQQYSVEENDVMVFSFVSQSRFVVRLFKYSGMEFSYTNESTVQSTTLTNVQEAEIILLSDSSVELLQDDLVVAENEVEGDNMEANVEPLDANIVSFQVTLKPSHVDKKCHGVYIPPLLYPTYKNWGNSSNIRLMFGEAAYYVAVLRSNKMCRLGRGWTEFTVENELEEGQTIQMDYVNDRTFRVRLVNAVN
ncbi:hypothetical protein ACET3Z_001608 [Daucus carota]